MRTKPTFFNTRTDRLHWDYIDTNNHLFTILFNSGAELSFILRDLKKNKNILKYIYNKMHNRFDNIAEIDISTISIVDYNLLKQYKVPSEINIC